MIRVENECVTRPGGLCYGSWRYLISFRPNPSGECLGMAITPKKKPYSRFKILAQISLIYICKTLIYICKTSMFLLCGWIDFD